MRLTRGASDTLLWSVRALSALLLALTLGFSPNVHLSGLIGALGMYAITDGVLSMLIVRHSQARAIVLEAVASVVFGFAILLGVRSQQGLLVAWSLRNLLTAGPQLWHTYAVAPNNWLRWHGGQAMRAYAALSALIISSAFLVARLFDYGALDMHACIAGQLGFWALPIGGHALRMRRRIERARDSQTPGMSVTR